MYKGYLNITADTCMLPKHMFVVSHPACTPITAGKTMVAVEDAASWPAWDTFLRDVCAPQGQFGMWAVRKQGNIPAMRNIPFSRNACPAYTAHPILGPSFPPPNWRSTLLQYQTQGSPFNLSADLMPNTSFYVTYSTTPKAVTSAMKAQQLFPFGYVR
jgi:hypothetical protein